MFFAWLHLQLSRFKGQMNIHRMFTHDELKSITREALLKMFTKVAPVVIAVIAAHAFIGVIIELFTNGAMQIQASSMFFLAAMYLGFAVEAMILRRRVNPWAMWGKLVSIWGAMFMMLGSLAWWSGVTPTPVIGDGLLAHTWLLSGAYCICSLPLAMLRTYLRPIREISRTVPTVGVARINTRLGGSGNLR